MIQGRFQLICAAAILAGGCSYKPGSFNSGFAGPKFQGQRHTVGCLDVSVGSMHDAEAEGPVAAITVGNRCDTAVRVDLGAIRAEATTVGGRREPMRAFDPKRQIRPVTLEARRVGRENIEYQLVASRVPITQICLDIAGIDAGAPSPMPVVTCMGVGGFVATGEVLR